MTDNDERPLGDGTEPGGDEPTDPDLPGSRRGQMRFQDENTVPREPSLAERRARELAARREAEAEVEAAAAAEAARKRRKRLLIGGGVTVGVVALIALAYSGGDDEVDARCVDPDGVVVDDSNCATPVAGSSYDGGGYHYGGGVYPYPIFIGGGGRQYHYNYGGTGSVGQPVSGGTTSVPDSRTTVRSGTSGRTISGGSSSRSSSSSSGGSDSVSRGGLGVSGGGSSSGS